MTDGPPPEVALRLPGWLREAAGGEIARPTLEGRMSLVLEWARGNVERETGGPFAAGVFEGETGRLVAPGVNLVVPERCSAAHAEVVALSVAQQRLGSHDLSAAGTGAMELVASAEPCAMCLGAVHWSGVRRLACAARAEDVGAVGFDEGPLPEDWPAALARRGVEVVRDVARAEARRVLSLYRERGGPVYNAGRDRG